MNSSETRFIEEYTNYDNIIEIYEKERKEYIQMLNTLKQKEIMHIMDDALKVEASTILSYIKIDGAEIHESTKKIINNLSAETIYRKINNYIYNIEHYAISEYEKRKKLLLQIKELGLLDKYYYLLDVADKLYDKDNEYCKKTANTYWEIMFNAYKKTDYISQFKEILDEDFCAKILNKDIVLIQQLPNDPLGDSFKFKTLDIYKIIPESVRINNLEDINFITINGHNLYTDEDKKNVGKYIVEGNNEICLNLKVMPNKVPRCIVYFAKVNKDSNTN